MGEFISRVIFGAAWIIFFVQAVRADTDWLFWLATFVVMIHVVTMIIAIRLMAEIIKRQAAENQRLKRRRA